VFQGTPSEVAASETVRAAYLGSEEIDPENAPSVVEGARP